MLRAMTFNLRVATPHDGPDEWKYRRDAVGAMLNDLRPDVMGFQEATPPQIDDLVARVGRAYAWAGGGRNRDGGGEFCPIFYRTDRFECLSTETFWLGERNEAAPGWDASFPRIATWVRLRDRTTSRRWLVLNTHLDHEGHRAREKGAQLIAQRLPDLRQGAPAVVMGDFNCGPDSPAHRAMLDAGLHDTRTTAVNGHRGPTETFTGFHRNPSPHRLIDFIFVTPDIRVISNETLASDWAGRQTSDHRAVMAELEL